MKISGFTFIRNGQELGYPFVPSIRSLLALCDEVVVNVPRSTDQTLAAVRAIGDPRIRVLETEWDKSPRAGGRTLSHHTNLALRECTGDWCVYIQGDEVLHEDSVPAMRAAMQAHLDNPRVQGLLVDYTHFYGSFWTYTYSFGWYYKEVRVVRRDPSIQSVGDAQGFRAQDGQKLWVKPSGGQYFHYGFALEPTQMRRRKRNLTSLYHKPEATPPPPNQPVRYYDDDQKVRPFTGTHPAVMRETVAAAHWTYQSRSPLIRFRRNYFWEDIALLLKQCTGITLGVHKNYRLLR
jgi:hypothetical protein